MRISDELMSEAVVTWIGWGYGPYPQPSDERVVAKYGEEFALDALPRIRALYESFYMSDAGNTTHGLAEMGRKATADFRPLHPELSDAAIAALSWCYTWDYK